MSIYRLKQFDSNNSFQKNQKDGMKIQSHFIINNIDQANIPLTNSFSQWNKSKMSNSFEKSHFVDLQNLSQSIPNFSSFLQTLSNMKSSKSIEDDFMDNHLEAYYQAIRVYTQSLNSEFSSHRKIKSFINSKLYTETTYQQKKLATLINQSQFLSNDEKQALLQKLNKQKCLKQFLEKILSQQALQISHQMIFCLNMMWSQYILKYQETLQAQLKQNCSKKAQKIVEQNWEAIYYHQNIKFINMRKVEVLGKNSKQLQQFFINFLLKFTETILFIIQGFFSHNVYQNYNSKIENKQNICNYNVKNNSRELIQKLELKRSFKSFKLISSALDIAQSQQQDQEHVYRMKPRKKTKLQNVHSGKNSSNTSMEFVF